MVLVKIVIQKTVERKETFYRTDKLKKYLFSSTKKIRKFS